MTTDTLMPDGPRPLPFGRNPLFFRAEEVPGGTVSVANVREAEEGPYAAVASRLSPELAGNEPAEETLTPIQQATRPAQPDTVPGAAPAANADTAAGDTTAPPDLSDPYATPEPAEPVAPAEQEPAWVADLRQAQTAQAQYLAALAERVVQPAAETPAEEPDLDLLSGEELRAYIAEQNQRAAEQAVSAVRSELAPFTELLGQVAKRESREAAEAYYSELEGVVGRFNHDQAHLLAYAMTAQGVDPVQAMYQAAQRQHEFERGLWQSFSERRQATVDNVVAAPSERPASPAAASEIAPTPSGINRYEDAAANFMARRRPQPVTA